MCLVRREGVLAGAFGFPVRRAEVTGYLLELSAVLDVQRINPFASVDVPDAGQVSGNERPKGDVWWCQGRSIVSAALVRAAGPRIPALLGRDPNATSMLNTGAIQFS